MKQVQDDLKDADCDEIEIFSSSSPTSRRSSPNVTDTDEMMLILFLEDSVSNDGNDSRCVFSETSSEQQFQTQISNEFQMYLHEPKILSHNSDPSRANPLLSRKQQMQVIYYPILARVARKYLSIHSCDVHSSCSRAFVCFISWNDDIYQPRDHAWILNLLEISYFSRMLGQWWKNSRKPTRETR